MNNENEKAVEKFLNIQGYADANNIRNITFSEIDQKSSGKNKAGQTDRAQSKSPSKALIHITAALGVAGIIAVLKK